MQRTDKGVVLEVSLQRHFGVSINSLPVHFVRDPLATIITLVSPGIGSLTVSVAVLELAFVDIPIRKNIQTYI